MQRGNNPYTTNKKKEKENKNIQKLEPMPLTIAQRKQTLLSPNYASILSPSHERSFLIICHGYQLSPTPLQITLVVEAGYISLNCFMNSSVKKKKRH